MHQSITFLLYSFVCTPSINFERIADLFWNSQTSNQYNDFTIPNKLLIIKHIK